MNRPERLIWVDAGRADHIAPARGLDLAGLKGAAVPFVISEVSRLAREFKAHPV
jgi:hypothetical protein